MKHSKASRDARAQIFLIAGRGTHRFGQVGVGTILGDEPERASAKRTLRESRVL
jgi:hypothetical protein